MFETNFDWDDLRLFLAVARGGGLSAAKASTGKSAPTLGRRMLDLERRLGCDLFRRQAKGYELTDRGEALLARVGALESRIQPIVEGAGGRSVYTAKISAGSWVTHILCAAAAELVGSDRTRLRFVASEDMADIGRREAVIGVRNQRPEGVALAGRRVGRVRFAVYAAAAAGASDGATVWAQPLGATPSARWVRENAGDAATIEVTNPRNALDLTLAGHTRAVLPTFIGDRTKGLRRHSSPIEELDHDQWLVTHHDDRFIPQVRHVIDRLYTVLTRTCGPG
ncbi:MAG: LysR family transcriptional regulator [Alphaproteobacteria bacterium]|nr:LysR family transcriptional regulator [Alphaproteobacteria bacterium]